MYRGWCYGCDTFCEKKDKQFDNKVPGHRQDTGDVLFYQAHCGV